MNRQHRSTIQNGQVGVHEQCNWRWVRVRSAHYVIYKAIKPRKLICRKSSIRFGRKNPKRKFANKISNLIADRCDTAIAFVRTRTIHRPNYHCRRHQHFDHVAVWPTCWLPGRWYSCCAGRRTSSVWFVPNFPHPNAARKRSAIIICC